MFLYYQKSDSAIVHFGEQNDRAQARQRLAKREGSGVEEQILFNNNYTNNSAVFELVTPLNENGLYSISEGQSFGPEEPVWLHTGNFHTQMQGGAFRLPNGNTIITDCDDATIFEVTYDHEEVWSYNFGTGQIFIARAQKYELDYLGSGFPEYTLGDVNFDNTIDVKDLLMISDMASGFGYSPTPPADYNLDGSVNISDVVLLLQEILSN